MQKVTDIISVHGMWFRIKWSYDVTCNRSIDVIYHVTVVISTVTTIFTEKDMLFVVVNEMTTDSKSLAHHLWSYRPRITLGHLKQTLQQTNMQKHCSILDQFLNEVIYYIACV